MIAEIDQAQQVSLALQWHEQGLDFADALHLSQSKDCKGFYTFDERFVKRAQRIAGCEVKRLDLTDNSASEGSAI